MRYSFALLIATRLLVASSRADPPPLIELPPDRVAALAPLLARGEIAAVEPGPGGRPSQISFFAFTPADPEVARQTVLQADRHPEFVRSMTVTEHRDAGHGWRAVSWKLGLPVGSWSGGFAMRPRPDGAIDIYSLDCIARWHFLAAPGGGTVIAEYMIFHPLNPLAQQVIARNASYETGIVMAAGLMLIESVADEATRRGGGGTSGNAMLGPAGSLDFLLERGPVALIRQSAGDRLIDVNVLLKVPGPAGRLRRVIRAPEEWASFVPAVRSSEVVERQARSLVYRLQIEGVLFDLDTRFRMELIPEGADSLGVDGDLVGARLRWDLLERDGGTLAMLRGNLHLGDGSLILGALLRIQPIFEAGLNAGAATVFLQSMAARAAAP